MRTETTNIAETDILTNQYLDTKFMSSESQQREPTAVQQKNLLKSD